MLPRLFRSTLRGSFPNLRGSITKTPHCLKSVPPTSSAFVRYSSTVVQDSKDYVGNGGLLQHGQAPGENRTQADLGDRVHDLLPSRWYRDEKIYQLERRAIFSKYWHIASHMSRFKKTGDYLSLDLHGWSVVLIRDEDGKINTFHNVCRHRAYPVAPKEAGCSKTLTCKYHGWSYTPSGSLRKAPKYTQLSGFDPEEHSLFKIHTHITPQGFIFVNLDSSATPTITFQEQFGNHFDGQTPSQESLDFRDEYRFLQPSQDWIYDNTWKSSEFGTKFNWKTYADGFQECYHCPTGHASTLPQFIDFKNYYVRQGVGAARHFVALKDSVTDEYQSRLTWLFPLGAIVYSKNMLFIGRYDTRGAGDTRIQHETYRSKDVPSDGSENNEWLEELNGWRFIETEDIELSQGAQKGYDTGVLGQGRLHPVQEHAVKWYQDKVKHILSDHAKLEAKVGKAIDYSVPGEQGTLKFEDPLEGLLGPEITL